ncbi:MAG: hypothetical protein KTQ13_07465 [Ferruginibacter sp.]|nr:hypothetical protein [Ferruginibacter sp.]MBU9936470.1 hypothetical protein [Ferruginibacter sp.]
MKNLIIFGLFILTLVFAQFAQAQTADDVVNKYIDALGGKEKLSSLKSVRLSGSMNIQGTDIAITITKLHMKGMRMDISVMGTENYQIVTPGKGVTFMPVQGMASPTDMSEEQATAAQSQLDVQSALLDYKEKGTSVELLGKEKVDGVDNFKLKVTYKNGIATTYYIGSDTYRLNKTVSKRTINGEEMEIENTYTNYKQVDGFWFPFTSTSSVQGETNYDKIETNITVDENIFK